MTFERAWVLLFLLLPAAWLFREWPHSARRRALVLKAATLAALIVALSEPVLRYWETKVAVVLLVDTSASVTAHDLERASEAVSNFDHARGRNSLQVIPFARTTRDASAGERTGNSSWRFVHTAGDKGRGTDIEGALRDAVAAMPPGLVPRAVLVSDGNENQGSIARAVWQAQQLGIPVDTVPLAGHERPKLHLESVSVPAVAFTGERFPIDLVVTSPSEASGTVEISAEGKSLGSSPVAIEAGGNHLLAHASLTASGALSLSGALRAPGLGEARFDQAMTLRRPHVLFLSQDPAGTETHLMQTLAAAQFDV